MPRTAILELRNVESAMTLDREVVCPLGDRIHETAEGPACHCRAEQSLVSVARDLSSFSVFCTGDHTMCPTFRAAREAEWNNEAISSITKSVGYERTYALADLEEMEERRAAGDFAGAQKIQDRIYEARRSQGLMDVER
jgi:hypothetical protein